MSAKPADADLFLARWRDRLALVKTEEQAAKFCFFMQSIANEIEVVFRPEFGKLHQDRRFR